ncbi:AMP-binding protein [Streptomyces triticirhizae]|uniref:AMP-binding protein n=1 Tax=Streptomyces triticirhizae TaxID=2483353 RepID=UPI0013150B2C|nr:AMP-binding protein [Streptomyces triticirhizae]
MNPPGTTPQLPQPATLAHALARHAAERGDALAVHYLTAGGVRREHSYAELHRAALALGARLADLPGDQSDQPFVLIALPGGLDYVTAFFACLAAGATAVTYHPPALSSARAGRGYDERLARILRDCRPSAVLAETDLHERLARVGAEVGLTPWLLDPTRADEAAEGPPPLAEPLARPERLGLLQYTSGSTSEPKGVMVSNANLVHNAAGLAANLGSGPGQTAVGWLPLFHDMGLIGMICHPVLAGMAVRMSTPAVFLRQPVSWLREISDHRATVTIAPDFGYATAARKIPEHRRDGLDLSSLRHALNGAEPVRPRTIEEFAKQYAPWGLDPHAMMPVYGLAEGTLCVTCLDHRAEPALSEVSAPELRAGRVAPADGPRRVVLVGCGRSFTEDTDVAVVDPATRRRQPEGHVGEIWVNGPSVAGGYWRRPEATEEIFAAVRRAVVETHGVPVSEMGLLRPGAVPRTTSGKVQRRESARRWAAGEFTTLARWPDTGDADPRTPDTTTEESQ